ncbi:hypothetical protein CIB48_g7360 [Xylaria polymorpha]|nr:hypothetical protein CIB48_g7360 [Xylaria polymorpha]
MHRPNGAVVYWRWVQRWQGHSSPTNGMKVARGMLHAPLRQRDQFSSQALADQRYLCKRVRRTLSQGVCSSQTEAWWYLVDYMTDQMLLCLVPFAT